MYIYTVQKTADKRLGDILRITTSFNLSVQILNTDQIADELNNTVTLEAIAGRHFFSVDFSEVKLLVEVMKQGAVLVSVDVEETL